MYFYITEAKAKHPVYWVKMVCFTCTHGAQFKKYLNYNFKLWNLNRYWCSLLSSHEKILWKSYSKNWIWLVQLELDKNSIAVFLGPLCSRGAQPFGISGPHWKKSCLGHTLNTQILMKTDEQKKVLSKFTIFCWAAFIAIQGCGLDTLTRTQGSDDTRKASMLPLREDTPARMTSSTRETLVTITVQEWRSCSFTQ